MAWLVARVRVGGFKLLDTQFLTPHLASMGTTEVPRNAYQSLLSEAVATPADFGALDSLEAPAGAARGGEAAGAGALSGQLQIGRAACRERVGRSCRLGCSPFLKKQKN